MAPTKQKYFPKKIGLKLCIKLVFFLVTNIGSGVSEEV
jgi:hypothetical protein